MTCNACIDSYSVPMLAVLCMSTYIKTNCTCQYVLPKISLPIQVADRYNLHACLLGRQLSSCTFYRPCITKVAILLTVTKNSMLIIMLPIHLSWYICRKHKALRDSKANNFTDFYKSLLMITTSMLRCLLKSWDLVILTMYWQTDGQTDHLIMWITMVVSLAD